MSNKHKSKNYKNSSGGGHDEKSSRKDKSAAKGFKGHGDRVMSGNAQEYSLPTVTGVIDCKSDRFGFVANAGGDVFISGRDLCGARHGDTVRAIIIGERGGKYKSSRREGRVIEIVERNPYNIVATVVYDHNRFCAAPDDKRYGEMLEITSLGGASEYDKVIISIVQRPNGDCARVDAVLGRYDEIGMDVKSVIASHNLRTEFPVDVLEQADELPDCIDGREAAAPYRVDFRDKIIFTIDGSDSKDFDDAVSIEKTESGYRLGVYIADVAEYVTERSPLDREAYARGTSVYLADRVIPMLPEKLSNGLCSLNEGEDRLVLAAIIDLNDKGVRTGYEICEGVIRSTARLTYTGVQAMLDGDTELREKYAAVYPSLELMQELARKRIELRKKRGAIEFTLTETQIKFDAAGHVADIEKRPSLMSMRIIEEFMILANCAVAERFEKAKIPFVYRSHERPSVEKIETLNDWLEAVGSSARCPSSPSPKQVAELLEKIDPELAPAANRVALRSMAKATYEPRNDGHFGLAEEYYCHFTSPIRRYPDLMIHRIIKQYLRCGGKGIKRFRDIVTSAATQSSKQERVAQECERKVDDFKKAEYMSRHIGDKYVGVISSVTEFGFFVELDNSAEGLVRMGKLPPAASFDQRRLCISCGRKKFKLGDSVEIIVEKVEGDRVDFNLA